MNFNKGDRIRMVRGACDCALCEEAKTIGCTFLRFDGADFTGGYNVKMDSGTETWVPSNEEYQYELFYPVSLENE